MTIKKIITWVFVLALCILVAVFIRNNINVLFKQKPTRVDRVLAPDEYEIWLINDCEYIAYKNENGQYTLTLKVESYISRVNGGEY